MNQRRSFKLTVAYDGTDFAGWQRQPDRRTVQGDLEAAWRAVTNRPASIMASGRTDAGVHALGQVASVDSDTLLSAERLCAALNAHLQNDLVVLEVIEVRPGFHALRDTVRKRYRYVIQDGRTPDIFARRYAWHVRYALDERRMDEAAQALAGTHDFDSFESTGSQRLTTRRTIFDIEVARPDPAAPHRVTIEVEADGFLYNMVRNITGTLVAVGRGRHDVAWVAEVLAARDRKRAGMAAPPQGLFLVRVDVADDIAFEGNSLDANVADEAS